MHRDDKTWLEYLCALYMEIVWLAPFKRADLSYQPHNAQTQTIYNFFAKTKDFLKSRTLYIWIFCLDVYKTPH